MTLSDLEGHLLFETFVTYIPREIKYYYLRLCLQMNRKAHAASNFNCLFETE